MYHFESIVTDIPVSNPNLLVQDVRPIRADALKNRNLLLETAKRLFAERGVEAVPMSAVAHEAGVGKGTLYRHFPSKAELCEELIDHDQRDLQTRTLQHLREHTDDPLGSLRWFLVEALGFIIRNQILLFASVDANVAISLNHPAHAWWRLTIAGLLMRLRPAIDVEYAADVLFVLLDPRTIHFQVAHRGYLVDRVEAGLLATLEHLIG